MSLYPDHANSNWVPPQIPTPSPIVPIVPIVPPKPRSCNLHVDCDAADVRIRSEGPKDYYGRPLHHSAGHCNDECCEECLGK